MDFNNAPRNIADLHNWHDNNINDARALIDTGSMVTCTEVNNMPNTAVCLAQSFDHAQFSAKLRLAPTNLQSPKDMAIFDANLLMGKDAATFMCAITLT